MKAKNRISKLPFAVNRELPDRLTEQVVDGLRMAIASGYYPLGERVPSLHEFARLAKVSLKVPRTAYARLVGEGWLTVRHGAGYAASSPDVQVWKGRVLFVQCGITYAQSVIGAEMQRLLIEAGYRVMFITMTDAGPHSLAALEAALLDHYDLVFSACPDQAFERLFEASGIPYVVTHGGFVSRRKQGKNCRGVIVADRKALRDLCAAVRKAKVKTVAWVDFLSIHGDYAAALARTGVKVQTWQTPLLEGCGRMEGVRRGAERYFAGLLSENVRLPELLVFTDDFVADGALYALATAGVRIPEDVRVVALYNKGLGLACPADFTRLEIDHVAVARRIVEFLVAVIRGRTDVPVPHDGPVFVRGTTF